jgi:hypothetical protein
MANILEYLSLSLDLGLHNYPAQVHVHLSLPTLHLPVTCLHWCAGVCTLGRLFGFAIQAHDSALSLLW